MNDLTTTTPADAFRAKASNLMVETAGMTLHQLVDEFQRLTLLMDANSVKGEDGYGPTLSEDGELAARERRIVVAASRARFGISFDTYDRVSSSSSDW